MTKSGQFLPYLVDQHTAEDILHQWQRTSQANTLAINSIEHVYLPYYIYDVEILVHWHALAGQDGNIWVVSKSSMASETETYWRWTNRTTASGQLEPIRVRGIFIPAGLTDDTDLVGKLVQGQKFSEDDHLAQMSAEGSVLVGDWIRMPQARDRARQRVEALDLVNRQMLEDGVRHQALAYVNPSFIHQAGAVDDLQVDIRYTNEQLKPVWLPVYRVLLADQEILINGVTGRLCVQPHSRKRHPLVFMFPALALFWLWVIFPGWTVPGTDDSTFGIVAILALFFGILLALRGVIVNFRTSRDIRVYQPKIVN